MEKLRELFGKMGSAKHQLALLDVCFGGLIEKSTEDPAFGRRHLKSDLVGSRSIRFEEDVDCDESLRRLLGELVKRR